MAEQSFDPARVTSSGTVERPTFVSRSALEKRVDAPLLASDGSPLPTLRTNYVRWILCLALALQVFAWWRVDGYQLADSVEFMERSRALVHGEELIDEGTVRPVGFSFLLVPFFVIGQWFGVSDGRAIVWCIVLVQMALGLVLAWRCMRIGARLAGKTGAIAAGFVVATCPVFLQYSTQPVSDLAAGVCVAYALELVLERGSFRRALIAGLWLGLGFMVAYKTMLVTLLLIAVTFGRDRFKKDAAWRGLLPGVMIAMLVQSTLDWLIYDHFGASIVNYAAANGLGIIAIAIYRVAVFVDSKPLYDFGVSIYDYKEALLDKDEWEGRGETAIFSKQPLFHYFSELPSFLSWPVIAVAVVAVVSVVLRRKSSALLILTCLVGALSVMSLKGAKDFRLVLPLLPFIAPLIAYGWSTTVVPALARFGHFRGLLASGAALAALVLSVQTLQRINVKLFGGYWDVSDWVDERARSTFAERRDRSRWLGSDSDPEPLRVGYAYHWAVYLRHSPLVQISKLPWQLNLWAKYGKQGDGGKREKAADFAALEDLDLFVVHQPILTNNADLMRFVNARFEVVAALYDQRTYGDIGPIFVLQKRTGSPRAHTFFDVTRGVDESAYTSQRQIEPVLDFVDFESGDRLRLLGVEYTTLPPFDFGWITYHWRATAQPKREWMILDRLTSPYEKRTWENNHVPAHFTQPTSTWASDEILAESYLVVPAQYAYDPAWPVEPIGNAYRRGDLIPTRTWMKLVELDPQTLAGPGAPVILREATPARVGAATAVRAPDQMALQEMPDGIQFAVDDFVRVASFYIPVLAPWRLPDDGRTVED